MNKFENRFGNIREEKMLAVKIDARELAELQVPKNDDVVQRTPRCAAEHQ